MFGDAGHVDERLAETRVSTRGNNRYKLSLDLSKSRVNLLEESRTKEQ